MANSEFDEIDVELLTQLDKNGEIDVDEASADLDVSTSTIYYRLDNYRKQGILNGNIANLDPEALGLNLTAFTTVETTYDRGHDEIAEDISSISGVQAVYSMFGQMSFFVFSMAYDHSHLQEIAESIIEIDGIENSTTNLVLRTYADPPNLLANYNDEDLEQIFFGT